MLSSGKTFVLVELNLIGGVITLKQLLTLKRECDDKFFEENSNLKNTIEYINVLEKKIRSIRMITSI